ncbi:PEGA domain-containing protein [Haliangium sp.]|uniref:PEGA domain-containing protein n=1 Tax=Haliangium sp. TaxID=2663208 RepID=UPI003D0A5B29
MLHRCLPPPAYLGFAAACVSLSVTAWAPTSVPGLAPAAAAQPTPAIAAAGDDRTDPTAADDPAAPDTDPSSDIDLSDAAWATEVSDEDQAQALDDFYRGLDLHEQLLFEDAAEAYQRAIERWPHPKFLLYRSHALSKQGEPLAAHQLLQQVLSADPRALAPSEHDLARSIERDLLARELAAITVRCDEPGAEVTVNGQPWFTGPGTHRSVVRAGAYVVAVDKPGYVTVTRSVTLRRGEWSLIEPRLVPERDAVLTHRRWHAWLPWIITATGVVATGAGAGLYTLSNQHLDTIQRRVADACEAGDCGSVAEQSLYRRAQIERTAGIATLAAGGATLTAALVMHYLNRTIHSPNQDAGSSELEMRPLIAPDGAGMSLRLRF